MFRPEIDMRRMVGRGLTPPDHLGLPSLPSYRRQGEPYECRRTSWKVAIVPAVIAAGIALTWGWFLAP